MLTLASKKEQEIVERAIKSPEGTHAYPVLIVGEHDFSGRVIEGEWGQTEIPISLNTTLAKVLPRRFGNAPVRLYVDIEGVLVPQLFGAISLPIVRQDQVTTALWAATPGSLLNGDKRVKLNQWTEYQGLPPEAVVRDAVHRLPYDRGLVRIEPLGAPLLNFAGHGESPGFAAEEGAGDVLSRVQPQTGYAFRDTAYGGFVAEPFQGFLQIDGSVLRSYDSRDMPGWIPPALTDPQYSDVSVFRLLENGDDAYRITIDVDYRGFDYPPPANTTLPIPFTETSGNGPELARQRAVDEAEWLGRGRYAGETRLPSFDPLVEKGDTFRVEEMRRDDDGTWSLAWLCIVKGYKHPYSRSSSSDSSSGGNTTISGARVGTSTPSLSTVVSYSATVLYEDLLKVPTLVVPGGSTGILTTPGPPYGIDEYGLWIDVEATLNSSGEPWAGIDENGLWIAPALSEGQANIDGGGLWLDVFIPALAVGEDEGGLWVNADDAFDTRGRRWAGVDEDGLWIDPLFSAPIAGVDENGLWIDLPEPPPPPIGIDGNGLWVDFSLTFDIEGHAWAGIDEDGLWIDPTLSEGQAGIDSGGLYLNI